MSSWKAWLHGLLGGIVSAASASITAAYAAPESFNFSHDGLVALAKLAVASGALGALLYLKQSPLPSYTETVTQTTKTEIKKE